MNECQGGVQYAHKPSNVQTFLISDIPYNRYIKIQLPFSNINHNQLQFPGMLMYILHIGSRFKLTNMFQNVINFETQNPINFISTFSATPLHAYQQEYTQISV